MNVAHQVREYIAAHPGCTNTDIAAATGILLSTVASRTTVEFKRGRLERTQIGTTATRAPRYGYYLAARRPEDNGAPTEDNSRRRAAPATPVDAMIDQLAEALAARVAAAMQAKLIEAMGQAMPSPVAVPLPSPEELLRRRELPEATTPPRKEKIVIVGLLPQQAGVLTSEFGDCFDLRFFEGGRPSQLRAMAEGAKAVISHIRHTPHAYEDALKAIGAPLVRVGGGMTQIKDMLTRLYVEGK